MQNFVKAAAKWVGQLVLGAILRELFRSVLERVRDESDH
jgi:hypothetical protein